MVKAQEINLKSQAFQTQAIHSAQEDQNGVRHLVTPLLMDSAFPINDIDQGVKLLSEESIPGFFYSRYANPTVRMLEEKIAQLEGAEDALSCSSGMGAIWLTISTLSNAGDHIIISYSMYHEICNFLKAFGNQFNIEVTLADFTDVKNIEELIRDNTRMLFIETPSNPGMQLINIKAVSDIAKKNNILLIVDNTVLTFYFQKPLARGADITIYSTTKHINGHGDAIGGIICGSKATLNKIKSFRDMAGIIMPPFNAWLTIRGLKTMGIRMKTHYENAKQLATWLNYHSKIELVRYPELTQGKDYKIFLKQQFGGGPIVSFFIKGGQSAGTRFIKNLTLCRVATTFGNLETIVYHYSTFARPIDIDKTAETDGMIRVSVGIEDINDIIADFERALSYV